MSENELVEIRVKSLEIYLQYVRYRTSHHPYTLEEIVEQAKKIEKFILNQWIQVFLLVL